MNENTVATGLHFARTADYANEIWANSKPDREPRWPVAGMLLFVFVTCVGLWAVIIGIFAWLGSSL